MTTHRFVEQLRQTRLSPVTTGAASYHFVPCPMFAAMTAAQQSSVLEIYRIAAERTREQLKPRRKIPAFSRN